MTQGIMKNNALLALVGMVLLCGWGCRKDVEEIRPYPVTQKELTLFLLQVPDPSTTTTFEFDGLDEDKTLTTPDGARILLVDVDQLFATTAAPTVPFACSTCPDLSISLTIATSKGDILARALPTVTTDNQLLESGGMVELKAFCGNTALQLLPGRTIKVQLPAADPKEGFELYTGQYQTTEFLGWSGTGQEVFKADWPAPGGGLQSGYELVLATLGWSNCAKALPATPTTSFCINLQPSYTGLNTQAYLVFENLQVVAPLNFDDTVHSFCFPNIPAGYPVKIVSVAKLESAYWLGATTSETGTNSMLPVQPQKQEPVDLLGYLRGL
jgi:hypothetical protein